MVKRDLVLELESTGDGINEPSMNECVAPLFFS